MRGIIFLFLILPVIASAQAIVKGGGVVYTNGAPIHTINVNTDAETVIDTTTGLWYERSRDGLGWITAGFRVQKFDSSIAPTAAPLDKQSEVVLNNVDSLYRWRAGAWQHINKVLVYTAGTGISVTGTVIANTGDLVVTNEGTLGVGAGSGTSSTILSNTSGATGVTINAAGILAISESTSSNGGSITLTATEVDGSTSNELQTVANTSDATSHTVTLSNSGGSIQLVEGSNITLTTTGTSGAGIITIASTGGSGSTDLTFSGASSPVTLNSSSGTDITFTAGGINSFSATSGNITITATEVDGSTTNEAWTIDGDDADTEVISNQTVKFQGAGITTTDYNTATDVLLITSTEVDGSTSNELQTVANTSDASSHTVTLSNSGGSIQLVEGSNITLTTTGTSGAGIVTIAATGGGTTDLAFSGASSPVTLTSSTGTDVVFTAGSNVTLSQSGNNMTITSAGGGATYIIKTADEVVNNSTTMQNDDHFSFTCPANKKCILSAQYFITNGQTAEFKAIVTASGATTVRGFGHGAIHDASYTFNQDGIGTAIRTQESSGATGEHGGMSIFGYVDPGASDRTVVIQWAQLTATAKNTTALSGSYMWYKVID